METRAEDPGQTCSKRRPAPYPDLSFILTKVQACEEGFLVLNWILFSQAAFDGGLAPSLGPLHQAVSVYTYGKWAFRNYREPSGVCCTQRPRQPRSELHRMEAS